MDGDNKDLNQNQNIDIQAEIEKARKQERDKLHSDIEKLKADLAEKAKVCNDNYVTISNLQKELKAKNTEAEGFEAKLNKAKEDGKLEGSKDLEALQKELEDYKAKLAKAEKDFADYKTAEEVNKYKAEKIKDIDEEFQGLVKGVTKEEIDASYEEVKALQEKVQTKYAKKDTLPTPKSNSIKPKSTEDLVKKLTSMSPEDYRKFRQGQ